MNGKIMGVIFGAGLAIFVSAMFLLFMVSDPIVENVEIKTIEQRAPILLPIGENNPGDNSGFFQFHIYPHSGDPGNDYAVNLTEGGSYEYGDTGNQSCSGETPYSTTFDIVIKCGVTNEDGYWTANQTRNPDYQWALITCADLSIGADTNMTQVFIGNTTDYAWYHFYMDNTGSGYTIAEGESFNITAIKYYVQRIV